MQDKDDRTLTESVMLCPTYQTSWVTENLHDKSGTLPDPDTFTFDMMGAVSMSFARFMDLSNAKMSGSLIWKLVMQERKERAHCNALSSMTSFSVVLSCLVRIRNIVFA